MLTFIKKSRRAVNVASWNIEFAQPACIRCRPSSSTLASRLVLTTVLIFAAAGLYVLFYPGLSAGSTGQRVVLGGVAFMLFLALFAPLSLVWQHVEVRREHKKVIVTKFIYVPATLTVPVGNLRSITILAREGRPPRRLWLWRVLLFGELGGVDFCVDTQGERPEEQTAPARVADFVRYLQQLVPLPYQGPQILSRDSGKRLGGLSLTTTTGTHSGRRE